MPAGRPKLTPNEKRLRVRLKEVLDKLIPNNRGELSRAAKKIGVKKQSLSLYMRGEATPTPETLRKLCSGLQLDLNILGAIISASDLPARPARPNKNEQLPLSLAEAISFIPEEHMSVVLLKSRGQLIELKVSIDFSNQPKAPKRVKGQAVAIAS
jgi:transcriptional regulator with XRE-family HTH domain